MRVELKDGQRVTNVDGVVICEIGAEKISEGAAVLEEIAEKKLPYDSFMFSKGKRKYYNLRAATDILKGRDDAELVFGFEGLNLQVFGDGKLVDDYFNTDGIFRLRLARLAKDGVLPEIVIRVCAPTKNGGGNPYNEIGLKSGDTGLKITAVTGIFVKTVGKDL